MNKSKIHLTNLTILFIYMIVLTIVFKAGILIVSIVPIALHICINLGLFLKHFSDNRSLAYTYLLSATLILLIGFPSCWELSSLTGGLKL
jgi:uncharacterized BrkB/YihY/UPF0761 family membrane protein